MAKPTQVCIGTVLDEGAEVGLRELCRCCNVTGEAIVEMVAEGVVEPQEGTGPQNWRFSGRAVVRVQTAVRLQRDLGVNLPGAALALDLLEELEELRRRRRSLW